MDNEIFLEDKIAEVLKENPDYETIRGTFTVTLNNGIVTVEEA